MLPCTSGDDVSFNVPGAVGGGDPCRVRGMQGSERGSAKPGNCGASRCSDSAPSRNGDLTRGGDRARAWAGGAGSQGGERLPSRRRPLESGIAALDRETDPGIATVAGLSTSMPTPMIESDTSNPLDLPMTASRAAMPLAADPPLVKPLVETAVPPVPDRQEVS